MISIINIAADHLIQSGVTAGQRIAIDGYNVLITIEAAMSGGCIFKARDGCLRDLASIHGTYRKVNETIPALQLIGEFLKEKNTAVAGTPAFDYWKNQRANVIFRKLPELDSRINNLEKATKQTDKQSR